MEMTVELSEPLERTFIDEIGMFVGNCTCGHSACQSLVYVFVGQESELEYELVYDPQDTGEDCSANIQIYIRENKYAVFNGRCKNNHDLAQALRMTII